MSVRVAINGFGRIGRNILRAIVEAARDDIIVVGINDLGPVETNAHLLKYDSVHGKFPADVKVSGNDLDVGQGSIKVTSIRDPKDLPWKELDVDIAMECTGIFASREKASIHLADIADQNLKMNDGEKSERAIKKHAAEWIKNNQSTFDSWLK